MPPEDESRLDPAVVAALYAEHAAELRRFLIGVLRDPHLANDVLQNTFAKAVAVGHTAREESLKGWLFRVAYNEALAARRKQTVRDKAVQRLAWSQPAVGESPEEQAARSETIERVRAALDGLPPVQRQVVHMRIYEEKTFAAIAPNSAYHSARCSRACNWRSPSCARRWKSRATDPFVVSFDSLENPAVVHFACGVGVPPTFSWARRPRYDQKAPLPRILLPHPRRAAKIA